MAEKKTVQARLAEAWSAIQNPELDGTNPHFKNRYATLKATLAAVRAACIPAGLVYLQTLYLDTDRDSYILTSYVMDADGDKVPLSTFPVENIPSAQAFGSEMTYKKRQQAQADWCIVGEDDDDGNAAADAQTAKAPNGTRKQQTARPRANGGSRTQTAPSRFEKLKQLKAQALEVGITEDGMRGALDAILSGKPMKDATDTEIKACESCIAGLVRDKKDLMERYGTEEQDVG